MWYWVFKGIFLVTLKGFFRWKAEGVENIPQKTNFIIVANHCSFLDPLIVGCAIPQRVYWLALRGLYRNILLRWFMSRTKAALSTGGASERAAELIVQNKVVGIFPEGMRSLDGELREFRRGAAALAMRTGRPILPCAILGS